MGIYKYIRNTWTTPKKNLGPLWKERLIRWRREDATTRLEHPTRLDRARSLGYRAKQGFVVVRQRVLRGGRMRPRIRAGRRSRHYHQHFTLRKNHQMIAEERAQRKYRNMVVLNSYPLAKDGLHAWFEVILVDPEHPVIKADAKLRWVADNRSRVFHGRTRAGRKVRGMRGKGKGFEKARPSRRAHDRLQ